MRSSGEEVVFEYERYLTTSTSMPGWLDCVYRRSPFSGFVTSCLLPAIPFLLSLIVAVRLNFHLTFLATPAIYLGCFGIAWTAFVLDYASRRVHHCYAELRPCFLVSDRLYRRVVTFWLKKIWSRQGNLAISAVFFVSAAVTTASGLYTRTVVWLFSAPSIQPSSFPSEWYDGVDTSGKLTILLVFGLSVSLLLGPASRILFINLVFLLRLRKFPVIPSSEIIRARLRGVTNYYLAIAFSWFVGVGLFGVVFVSELDYLSVAFLVALSLLGSATFLTPQIIFKRYLASSYRTVCDSALQELAGQMGIVLRGEPGLVQKWRVPARMPRLVELSSITSAVARPGGLVYDAEDFLVLFFGQAVTIAAILLEL